MLSPPADGGDGWKRSARIDRMQKRLRLAQARLVVVRNGSAPRQPAYACNRAKRHWSSGVKAASFTTDTRFVTLSFSAAEIPVAPNEWLTRPRRIRLFVLVAAAMTAFNFIEALHFASSPNGAGVLFLVFAAPCAWLGWRVSRSGLKIAPDGIRVRGRCATGKSSHQKRSNLPPASRAGLATAPPAQSSSG